MSADENAIIELIFEALDELNAERPQDQHLEKIPDLVLFGKGGHLDSLGLVNLIIAVEERLARRFGAPFTLADDRALSQTRSPFRSIRSLAAYAAILVAETARGC